MTLKSSSQLRFASIASVVARLRTVVSVRYPTLFAVDDLTDRALRRSRDD
jgi:hypothetical protein